MENSENNENKNLIINDVGDDDDKPENETDEINDFSKMEKINIDKNEKENPIIEKEDNKDNQEEINTQQNDINEIVNKENVLENDDNNFNLLIDNNENGEILKEGKNFEELIDSGDNEIKAININEQINNEQNNNIKENLNSKDQNEIKEKQTENEEQDNIINNVEENNIISQNEIKENEVKNIDFKLIEKITKLSETNYKEFITEKFFCDYSTGEEWRAGYIISISNDIATIIDAINTNNPKKKININDKRNISYIRKYSIPDNFMAKGTSKNLKNKLSQFINFHKDFDNYMQNCSNFDFYYFLRVTVYYCLDFCMNVNITSDNINTSFLLILSIMDIIIDCLKFIEKNFQEFLEYEISIKNTELTDIVLFDKKYAIFSFFDDINFLLKKIFSDSPEYIDWYIKFKKDLIKIIPSYELKINNNIDSSLDNIPQYKNGKLKKICDDNIYDNELHKFYTFDREINSGILAYFVDYFSFNDGFKILFKLIYSINTINVNNFRNIFYIQNQLIDDLFLVKAITNGFNNSHQEEKRNLENYVNNYMNKLEDKIFEKTDKKNFYNFFGKIFDLIEKNEEKNNIAKEKIIINFSFNKFLSEKKLEKRIFNLTEINNIILSVEYNDLFSKIFSKENENTKELSEEMLNDVKFKDRNKDIKTITQSEFCKMCQEKNIIHFILSNNSHEEIIKRLYPVIRIMYINNFGCEINEKEKIRGLKENLFKSLFQRLKEVEKNNEILYKILQENIINFTECLSYEDKHEIFSMIKNYFIENMNINTNKHNKINNIFNLMINFSLKSIDEKKINLEIKQNNEINISEDHFYCLDMLLQIIINKNKINELNKDLNKEQKIEITNLSIDGIAEILKKTDYNEILIKLVIKKIMDNAFTLINLTQSFILIEKLISKNIMVKNIVEDYCSKINDEEMIFLINELSKISMNKSNDELNNEEEDIYPFEIKFEKILFFIFILFESEKCIKKGYEKMKIFELLYSPNEIITKIFYEKLKQNISQVKYEIKIYIFTEILTKPNSPFEVKDIQSYQLLKEFIFNLNTHSNKFTYITEKEYIVLFDKISDIFGYEKLFQILLDSDDSEIQNDIQNIISDIYLNIKFPSIEKYKNFWNEIITYIINVLKKLLLEKNNNDNNKGIKGIIGLLKTIIEKSSDDGEILKNRQIINGLMDKVILDSKDKDKEKENKKEKEKDYKNFIKVIFEYTYFKEKESNKENNNINTNSNNTKNKNDVDKNQVNDMQTQRKSWEIYRTEFFYYLRYQLSLEFEIPLKRVQITIPTKDDDTIKLNLYQDYLPIYDLIKSNMDLTKKNPEIIINVRKVDNPLNDVKSANIKNIIKSNKELLSILRDLLKRKNSYNTLDILEIVKDKGDFIQRGMFDDFKKLLTESNANSDLLNELFNFTDANIFYKNLILSNLYEYITKSEIFHQNIPSQLVKSNMWESKLKNIDIIKSEKNKEKENINEFLEEMKYISNLLNIYIIAVNEFKNENDSNNMELISSKIFDIFYIMVDYCVNISFDNNDIKNIFYEIFEKINDLYKKKENISFALIKSILKEKEKYLDEIKYWFVDGILKNKFPFLNDKIRDINLSLIKNKIFKENKEDIQGVRNNFYSFLSSIFFNKTNNINRYVINIIMELFKTINDKNEDNYLYNIKSYFTLLSEILFITYTYTSKEINYENYIIESVIPFIYDPLIKKETKYSNKLNDIFFGCYCQVLCNYIQVMKFESLTKEQYDLIFNYKSKNLKKYLFDEIIMFNCDKDHFKNTSQLKKSFQIIHSSKEANHLFISLLIKDINNNKDLNYFLERITTFNNLGFWYGDEISNWKINPNSNTTVEEINNVNNKFKGLKNLGCTCYMNSLMQTFYSIVPFRESFLRFKIEQKTKNCLYEVQHLFFELKFCKERFYTPLSFVENYDNEKINTHVQMDIDEFFSNLLDKLETRLKNTDNENLIKYFFQGHINDVLTFQEGCTHHRTNTSTFYSVQMQIRNKKSLYESLDTLIEGELMNEDNCILCPTCNKKMPAIKSQNFKTLPRMLIFVLKRFEFDFNTMSRIKLNDYYEFPIDLDMNKYTGEYLNNKGSDINNKYKLKSIVIHQGHCEGGHYYAFIRDNSTQEWHQFNDTSVTEFDTNNIPKEAFGGNTNKSAYLLFYEKEDISNCEMFEKIKEVISLPENINKEKDKEDNIIEEDDNINNDNNINNINNDSDDEGFNIIEENKNEIKNEIKDENKNEIIISEKDVNENKKVDEEEIKTYISKKLFSKDYHHLTLELYLNILHNIDNHTTNYFISDEQNQNYNKIYNNIHQIEKQLDLTYKEKHFSQNLTKYLKTGKLKIFESESNITDEEKKERNMLIFKCIIINYFNVIIHSEERKYLGCYVDLIKSLIMQYEYCADYLLEEFCNYNVIMEYLKNCPLYEIKKITVGIIDYAMNTLINYHENHKDKEEKNINIPNPQENNQNEIQIAINNNNNQTNITETQKDTQGFELFGDEEITESKIFAKKKQPDIIDSDFEILDYDKEIKPKEDKGPLTKHYSDIIEENDKQIKLITKEIKQEKKTTNSLIIENNFIPKNIIDFIYNIIYVMKQIKYKNFIESRFLFAVLLQFSKISYFTFALLLNELNILLPLNLLLFPTYKERHYSQSIFDIGDSQLHKVTHKILDPKPDEVVRGEFDKFKDTILKYDFLLLCSLSYEKEEPADTLSDPGYSFFNKIYLIDIIKHTETRKELNYLSNLLKKKCLYNKDFFKSLLETLKAIYDKIVDSEDAFYDKFEPENYSEIYRNTKKRGVLLKRIRSILHVLFINLYELNGDNLVEYRQKEIISELFNLFRDNKRYYALSLFIVNIIIDIYLRKKETDKKKLNKINEIKEWLEKNKIAPKLYEIKGIDMYKDIPIHRSMFLDLKNLTEVNKKLKEDYDNEEIAKTEKKLGYINSILNCSERKTFIEMDLSLYNYDIGDIIFYANKKYEVIEVLDEMIKIKEIKEEKDDTNKIEMKFKIKTFKEKNKSGKNNNEECLWIEKDNYKIKLP